MKIYIHQPLYLIQLSFKRDVEHIEYLTLHETTMELTKAMLEYLFPNNKPQKNKPHKKTRIEIRERIGGKNGRYLAHSFYGESAVVTRAKVFEYVSKLNSREKS